MHLYVSSKQLGFILIFGFLSFVVIPVTSAQGPTPRTAAAMGTGITYQGQLKNGGTAYTGACDFRFSLFDAASSGSQIGTTQTVLNATVSGGLFTVPIDFGAGAFNGDARWLGINVRCPAGSGTYTALTSRQPLSAAPYALYATTANTANSATSATSALTANTATTATVALTANTATSALTANTATTATTALTAWNVAGNGGTDSAANFVGTTDNVTLTLRVHNIVGWRLAPYGWSGVPSVVGGYAGNTVNGANEGATIGGGGSSIYGANVISGTNVTWATIAGGLNNRILGNSYNSVIAGGYNNLIAQSASSYAARSFIGGGVNNTVSASQATIAGGDTNSATGDYSTVAGGSTNSASGAYSTVAGGTSNLASGDHSFAAGNRAKAVSDGSFVWSDSTNSDYYSSGPNQFDVRASGGINLYTSASLISGARLTAGSSSWAVVSDRNAKANFAPTNGKQVLARLNAIPVQTWNYKTEDPSIRHIGPMAQDFYTAFAVGEDDKHITTVDSDGVALAAIQGLSQIVQEKDAQIAAQQKQIDNMEARIAALEQANGTETHAAGPSTPSITWAVLAALIVVGVVVTKKRA